MNKRAEMAAGAIPRGRDDRGFLGWLFDPIANVLGFIISRLMGLMIIIIIILGIYLALPALGIVYNHIGDTFSAIGGFFNGWIITIQYSISCATGGPCAPLPDNVDPNEYGIVLDSVVSDMRLYGQTDNIIFTATPKATLLDSMQLRGEVKIDCGLEDGTLLNQYPTAFPIISIDGELLTCVYAPQVSPDSDRDRKATINITYDFKGITKIPISVVDAEEYQKYLKIYNQDTHNSDQAKALVADHFNVQSRPNAEAKLTPIQTGASLSKAQPISRGEGTVTLQVHVLNRKEGHGQIKSITVDVPDGMTITNQNQIYANLPNPIEKTDELIGRVQSFLFGKENLPSLEEGLGYNDYKDLLFVIDTSGFPIEKVTEATTKNIKVEIDYTYTVSESTYVNILTCTELGNCPVT